METKILKSQERLKKKLKELEDDIYERFLEGYLALLSYDDALEWSEANLNKIKKVDDLFSKELIQGLMAWILSEMVGLSVAAVDSFRVRGFSPKIDTVSMVERQLGWVNGKIVKGGYLDTLGSMEVVKLQLKNYVMSSIAQTSKLPDFIRGFKEILKGDASILERYYELYAYDTFAKVVRTTDLQVALSLGLKHFIYKGGLIETSRQFCIKRDGLKFRIDQAEDWRDDPDLPGRDTHPGYNPLTDLGRWNCRHILEYITEEEYLK